MAEAEYYVIFDMPHTMPTISEVAGAEMPEPYRNWLSGKEIPKGAFKVPIQYQVESADEMGAFYELDIPLMREDLVNILKKCGAKNLQIYPVELTAIDSGEKVKDYFAVNVVGLINAEMTKYKSDGVTLIKEVRIPDGAAKELVIFRLQEELQYRLVIAPSVVKAISKDDDLESVWSQELSKALFDAKGTMLL
jgi:hypothetical protein